MKVLGIIPARGGSKGIKDKNKKLLLGKPLIQYTLESALKSDLNHIVVSTDDEEISQISKSFKVQVIIRPKELSGDLVPTLPVLQHVYAQMNSKFDAIMTLQPTSPFRNTHHINESISLFKDYRKADSLVSVVKVPHNFTPDSLMEKKNDWLKHRKGNEVLRRQDKPLLYARNGAAIYITKAHRLTDFIIGGNILAYEMSKIESIDIDDSEDWELSELIMKSKQLK